MSDHLNPVKDETDFKEIVSILWSHKFLIVLVTGILIFISLIYIFNAEKKYTAKAIFKIEEKSKGGLNISSDFSAIAALAGISSPINADTQVLVERMFAREFILAARKKNNLDSDPSFNTYNPNHTDQPWKTTIKKLIGWNAKENDHEKIIENRIITNFRKSVRSEISDNGSISLSVKHQSPNKAAEYANSLMDQIKALVELESEKQQASRLSYLSETLADALQDMETAQQNLKNFALENSALAQENFISGSLKLDELRMERRKVQEIDTILSYMNKLIKSKDISDKSYESLRSTYPLVDDVGFRRILGMSETISAWSWPNIETIQAVGATLRDRMNRLNIEITSIEDNAKIYASSAGDLAKLTRDAKIAEATYTVLIEQVKSQSLAAGFQPETFQVFEYATPPLNPSSPKRSLTVLISATLGVFFGCGLALINSLRTGLYYTRSSMISDSRASLALYSKSFRRISKWSISKIASRISKHRVLEIDEAETKLAEKKLVYVINCGGRLTASATVRALAIQSSNSGRKVIICDKTGKSEKEIEGLTEEIIDEHLFVSLKNNLSLTKGNNGPSFFKSSHFNLVLEKMFSKFDQIFICADDKDAAIGLMALKKFNPSIVVSTRSRHTRRTDIQKINANQPIDILFYE